MRKLILLSSILLLLGCFDKLFSQNVHSDTSQFFYSDSIYEATHSFTNNEINLLPFRDIQSLGLLYPSAYYLMNSRMFFSGTETESGYIYVDGMKIRNPENFPFRSIGKITFYDSKIPSCIANSTGFNIVAETYSTNDSLKIFGEVFASPTAEYRDIGVNIIASGPLYSIKSEKRRIIKPSFMLAAEYQETNDYLPSSEDKYKAPSALINELTSDPLIPAPYLGTHRASEFTRLSDLEKTMIHPGAEKSTFSGYGRLNFDFKDILSLSIGTFARLNKQDVSYFENALFNYENNPEMDQRNFDNFINLEHQIYESENFSLDYSVFFQYSDNFQKQHSKKHKNRVFEYGYLGKYMTYKEKTYELGSIEVDGILYENVQLLNSWDHDTAYTFQNLGYNPAAAAYADNVYKLFPGEDIHNSQDLMVLGGLLNGHLVPETYPVKLLWNSTGTRRNSINYDYYEQKAQAYRGNFTLQAYFLTGIIKNHAIFGLEYAKSVEKQYGVYAVELWSLARGLTNFHILELDLNNPYLVEENGVFQNMVEFPRKHEAENQFLFDKNLRSALGLPVDGLEFILLDSYDKRNHTISYYNSQGQLETIAAPDNLMNLQMFGEKILLENNQISYSGYDIAGNEIRGKQDPYDFYKDFSIRAYQPINISFFVEDNFSFKNLGGSLGLRMNRYDANQPVLKDQYSLYETHTVGSMPSLSGLTHPANIGQDYYVYVDNVYSPTTITGYRDEDKWYDNLGNEISDPTLLDYGSGISPYLKNPGIKIGEEGWLPDMTFTDYKPELIFLPQINLNYILKKTGTLLQLNYNSWLQNPSRSYNLFRPEYYWLIEFKSLIPNPALKPVQHSKFDFSARQHIYKGLSVAGTFFNTWIKDYINYKKLTGFYPRSFFTPVNSTETIKTVGFTFGLDYQKRYQAGIRTGIALTKFYPDKNQPTYYEISDLVLNAHLLFDFGYRHHFVDLIRGKTFKSIFQNVGIGLYYQFRKGTPIPPVGITPVNYTHTPDFSFLNLKVQKGFFIKEKYRFDIYVWVENVLNKKNYFYVYPNTGEPDNNGYLDLPESQQEIEQQTDPGSYRDLYRLKEKNPNYYDIPSITRIGAVFSF